MLVILLTVLLDAVGIGLIMPILPALLRSLGGLDAGSLHYGALLAAYALMQFLFSPILGALSDWANGHPQEAAAILAQSTGLDQAIWARAIARMPFGSQRMSPEVFRQQQQLADKFTAIGLLPGKVDVNAARWSEDKPEAP